MEQLIAGLGFPVACCLGLAYYVKYQNEQMIQDNKEDKEMWKQELHCSATGALQYEINLRDKQIKELISKIEVLEKAILNKK